MKKAYVIAGHGITFLSSKPTKNGMPKFFELSTFDGVWVTDDKLEAEEKWHSFKHKFSWWHEIGVGVIELDNSDGIYDSAIAVCKQVSKKTTKKRAKATQLREDKITKILSMVSEICDYAIENLCTEPSQFEELELKLRDYIK